MRSGQIPVPLCRSEPCGKPSLRGERNCSAELGCSLSVRAILLEVPVPAQTSLVWFLFQTSVSRRNW